MADVKPEVKPQITWLWKSRNRFSQPPFQRDNVHFEQILDEGVACDTIKEDRSPAHTAVVSDLSIKKRHHVTDCTSPLSAEIDHNNDKNARCASDVTGVVEPVVSPLGGSSSCSSSSSSYYCSLCEKRYIKYTTYDNHINSYDHAHRQRLKDLQRREVHRQLTRWRRHEVTRKKRGKELQRIIAMANNGRQESHVVSGQLGSISVSCDSAFVETLLTDQYGYSEFNVELPIVLPPSATDNSKDVSRVVQPDIVSNTELISLETQLERVKHRSTAPIRDRPRDTNDVMPRHDGHFASVTDGNSQLKVKDMNNHKPTGVKGSSGKVVNNHQSIGVKGSSQKDVNNHKPTGVKDSPLSSFIHHRLPVVVSPVAERSDEISAHGTRIFTASSKRVKKIIYTSKTAIVYRRKLCRNTSHPYQNESTPSLCGTAEHLDDCGRMQHADLFCQTADHPYNVDAELEQSAYAQDLAGCTGDESLSFSSSGSRRRFLEDVSIDNSRTKRCQNDEPNENSECKDEITTMKVTCSEALDDNVIDAGVMATVSMTSVRKKRQRKRRNRKITLRTELPMLHTAKHGPLQCTTYASSVECSSNAVYLMDKFGLKLNNTENNNNLLEASATNHHRFENAARSSLQHNARYYINLRRKRKRGGCHHSSIRFQLPSDEKQPPSQPCIYLRSSSFDRSTRIPRIPPIHLLFDHRLFGNYDVIIGGGRLTNQSKRQFVNSAIIDPNQTSISSLTGSRSVQRSTCKREQSSSGPEDLCNAIQASSFHVVDLSSINQSHSISDRRLHNGSISGSTLRRDNEVHLDCEPIFVLDGSNAYARRHCVATQRHSAVTSTLLLKTPSVDVPATRNCFRWLLPPAANFGTVYPMSIGFVSYPHAVFGMPMVDCFGTVSTLSVSPNFAVDRALYGLGFDWPRRSCVGVARPACYYEATSYFMPY